MEVKSREFENEQYKQNSSLIFVVCLDLKGYKIKDGWSTREF